MSEIAITTGKKIRNYRENAHLSRETLAELADMHPTYLGQLERGEKNATLESISKVARGLDIPLEYLVENITGTSADNSIASKCYNLIAEQPLKEQESLYCVLQEIIKYKHV